MSGVLLETPKHDESIKKATFQSLRIISDFFHVIHCVENVQLVTVSYCIKCLLIPNVYGAVLLTVCRWYLNVELCDYSFQFIT